MPIETIQSPLETVSELSLNDYLYGAPEEKYQFISDFYSSFKNFGFVILKDHNIDEDFLNYAYDLSEKLFSLNLDEKLKYICKEGGGQRGYTPFGKEHAKDSHYPDLKEFWHVGRDFSQDSPYALHYPKNIWPEDFSEFKSTFQRLYQQLDGIGRLLLRALSGPLNVPGHFFDKMVNQGNSILRLLHYPPLTPDANPNSIRAAAHEDINLITILVAASSSGLEIKTRNGQWMALETSKNNLIVDAGDMLARITNDMIPSTTHRVVNPKGPNVSRYSMPFFMHPNPDCLLSCLPACKGNGAKYPDILAEEFLQQRIKEIGLKD